MPNWKAWYTDGSVFDSREHRWEDLPDNGVLVRMIYYDDGTRQIQQGMDFYYEAPHHSGEPILGTSMSLDEIMEHYPGAIVKRGRWAPDGYYRQVADAAMASKWEQ